MRGWFARRPVEVVPRLGARGRRAGRASAGLRPQLEGGHPRARRGASEPAARRVVRAAELDREPDLFEETSSLAAPETVEVAAAQAPHAAAMTLGVGLRGAVALVTREAAAAGRRRRSPTRGGAGSRRRRGRRLRGSRAGGRGCRGCPGWGRDELAVAVAGQQRGHARGCLRAAALDAAPGLVGLGRVGADQPQAAGVAAAGEPDRVAVDGAHDRDGLRARLFGVGVPERLRSRWPARRASRRRNASARASSRRVPAAAPDGVAHAASRSVSSVARPRWRRWTICSWRCSPEAR